MPHKRIKPEEEKVPTPSPSPRYADRYIDQDVLSPSEQRAAIERAKLEGSVSSEKDHRKK
jgi:hypothetical protein